MKTRLFIVISTFISISLFFFSQTSDKELFEGKLFSPKKVHSLDFSNTVKNFDAFSEQEKEEGSEIKPDNPDKFALDEFIKTRDPHTNTVPKERLLDAKEYADQLRAMDNSPLDIQWQERGPNNIGGRTRAILVDLNDATRKTIWAAGIGGGLWKTTDITAANPNWTSADNFFANLAVSCIVQKTSNPQEMYFGTGEGYFNVDAIRGLGIWKSSNGGANWQQLSSTNNTSFACVQRIAIHPSTGAVFAATRGRATFEKNPSAGFSDSTGGIWRSTDGGSTWTNTLNIFNGAASTRAADVVIGSNGVIYASMGLFQTDGIYKSTNNGDNWTKISTPASGFPPSNFYRIKLAIAPSNPNYLYAMVQNSQTNGILNIYKSIDGGTTWVTLPRPVDADPNTAESGADFTNTQAWYDLAITIDPNHPDTLFVGGLDMFKSSTGGTSWQQVTHWTGSYTFQYMHADQHEYVYEPGNSNVCYFGNDGGIFRTTNASASMPVVASKDMNYNITQYYGCAIHPTAGVTEYLAGAQDNGSHKFTSGGINSVPTVTGGDGCLTHIDQNEPQFQWTSYVYNNYFRSTDGGNTWSARISANNNGQFVNPTDYDNVSNKLYGANTNGNYFRWDDPQTGSTFSTVTVTAFDTNKVTCVTVSPNTPNRVFFGLETGKIVRVDSANTGTTKAGVNITSNLTRFQRVTPSCIAVQNGNDNHLLLTYSNYGWNSVWETTNGGTNWTSVEGNIPDMPVRWALFSPLNPDQALIATEVGVWSTDDLNGSSTLWGPSTSGLANVATYMIRYRTSDNYMIAATHGRGLYSSQTFAVPAVDFGADKTISYVGKSIHFIDNSTQAASWNWDFGDGTNSTQKNPNHYYAAPGTYNVTLTINGSQTKTKNAFITIMPNRESFYSPSNGGDFETDDGQFAVQHISGTRWEKGNSTVPGKDGTHSGTKAFVTGINETMYQSNSYTILYTPEFNYNGAGLNILVGFWAKFSCETGYDGFRMEYTTDQGDSWHVAGAYNPANTNWYNFPNITEETSFPMGEPYFTGPQPTWKQYYTDMTSLSGYPHVAYRIVFKSDANTELTGVAIDDFSSTSTGSTGPLSRVFVTAVPQGFLNNSGTMNMRDTVTVSIMNGNAPYNLVESQKVVLDSVTFTGVADLLTVPTGTYYVVVNHRNCIETWSKAGGIAFTRGNAMSYDFTTAQSQAYGNNLILKNNKYCLYSGDENKDGFINATDRNDIRNNTGSSGYLPYDMNGDGIINATDRTYPRLNTGISIQKP